MEYREVAGKILTAVGGKANVRHVMTCLTRLRLTLADSSLVATDDLNAIRGVLGVAPRGKTGIEVVLGPAAIEGVSREFSLQSGVGVDDPSGTCDNPFESIPVEKVAAQAKVKADAAAGAADAEKPKSRVIITPGHRSSYRAQQQAAINDERLGKEDLDALRAFLDDGTKTSKVAATPEKHGHALLVINGPNINLLGIREPAIYGKADYAALVRTCKAAAAEAGFTSVRCFQSNHEGAIVDEIQQALGTYDGIVMNPAAYTHTSVAILDALKAVALPCVEIHISKVEDREDFRQVSYVRQACFETITGMGLEGYRKAILDLAAHLGM